MNNRIAEKGLITGDMPLIARTLGISEVYVRAFVGGKRGKKPTVTQIKVDKTVEFFAKKNSEKISFAEQVASSDPIVDVPAL